MGRRKQLKLEFYEKRRKPSNPWPWFHKFLNSSQNRELNGLSKAVLESRQQEDKLTASTYATEFGKSNFVAEQAN
jgi:hypothetical protein